MKNFVVIGSGVAGLRAAIEIALEGKEVDIYTKESIDMSNTDKAQGGIAVVLKENDSKESHFQDTIKAGAGLCNEEAVRILVDEGPARVRELIDWGSKFDRRPDGSLDFTREAAHSTNRIVHALGDATGHEVERTLIEMVKELPIKIHDYCTLASILCEKNTVVGVRILKGNRFEDIPARSVIVATGGYGAVYKHTTNPNVTTGDGVGAALLAGAIVEDMEFIQFHPTCLHIKGVPTFLLSESMRGEGGMLINDSGEPFMYRYHELKELAPRDIVARSIIFEMQRRGAKHVYLDMRHLFKDFVKKRFPTIYETCLNYGIDITKKPVPIAPAAHYTMGGIKTNMEGKTNINGLFACGEAACTGVHGANRLASNSILEGLVFGRRAGLAAISYKDKFISNIQYPLPEGNTLQNIEQTTHEFQLAIDEKMGPIRTMKGLEEFLEYAKNLWKDVKDIRNSRQSIELRNMVLIGLLIATSALKRKSSVGAHYCIDTPHLNDKKHISLSYEQLKEFIGEN